jgi:DNA-binding transcriptional MerR regulator
VKTLQYYDELGLIKPARVDQFTGYRYYAHEQYQRLNRILALKDLGFSLENIRQLLDGGLTAAQVHALLEQQASETRQRMRDEQGRLARLEAWQTQMRKEDEVSEYEVVVKRVPALTVAAVRGVVPSPPDQTALWAKAMEGILEKSAIANAPGISVYHDEEPKEQDWDIEVCIPMDREATLSDGVTYRELPAVETMASVVHNGPFMTISNAYEALTGWVDGNGFRIVGPARELNIHVPFAAEGRADQADPTTVVEVQFPVEKA